MRFKAIVFDLGDILYDASAWRRWLASELPRYGVEVTYEKLVHVWERLLVDVYRGQAPYWIRFRDLLGEFGVPPEDMRLLEESARQKASEVQVDRQPMEGVGETLSKLKEAGLRLGVLSDNESGEEGLRKTLAQLGIEQHFDAVVSSADIGYVKPERHAFEAAANRLGVQAASCAFVGHDLDELEGAREAGMFVISYNCSPELPADAHIPDFRDLAPLCC